MHYAVCARRVLVEPRVLCVRRKSKPLCCTVRGPICAFPSFAPTGTICAQRVRAKPKILADRRKSNLPCCPIHGPICAVTGCAPPGTVTLDICRPSLVLWAFDVNRNRCDALYVSLHVQSRVVLLPGLWALDVYWPSLGLCAFDVNRTRCTALFVGLFAVQGCACRGHVRSTCAGEA